MTPRKPKARPVEAWAWEVSGSVEGHVLFTGAPPKEALSCQSLKARVVHLREVTPSDAQAARDDARVIRLATLLCTEGTPAKRKVAHFALYRAVELRSKHLKGKR